MQPMFSSGPLILGLGNVLMSDDGVGVHAVRALVSEGLSPHQCIEVGTAVLKAQELLEEAESVIVIDAIQANGKPGTVYCMDAHDAALSRRETLHDLSIAGVLRLIPKAMRPRVQIVGVEPDCLDYGMSLSNTVAEAMTPLLTKVKYLSNHESK
jgi:hydrogenase maturation protease